jgi:hypothetical protein
LNYNVFYEAFKLRSINPTMIKSHKTIYNFQETIGFSLFIKFFKFVLVLVLISYLLITLVLTGFTADIHVREFAALTTVLAAFIMRYCETAKKCDKAFAAIDAVKKQIVLQPLEFENEFEESVIQMRRNELVAILETARPLTGCGFFVVNNSVLTSIIGAATTYIVVLIQFSLTEQKV